MVSRVTTATNICQPDGDRSLFGSFDAPTGVDVVGRGTNRGDETHPRHPFHANIDARNAKRLAGTEPEPCDSVRLGHIPGSKNLPLSNLVPRVHTLETQNEIRAEFEAAGIDIMKPVVATCGYGVTACLLALGLAVLVAVWLCVC